MKWLNEIVAYFDLYAAQRTQWAEMQAGTRKKLGVNGMLALTWGALFCGIVFKVVLGFLSKPKGTGAKEVLVGLMFGVVSSVYLLPAVWKASIQKNEPRLLQLSFAFAFGAGVQGVSSDLASMSSHLLGNGPP